MSASTDPIKHVVVLMLENRSFDHMLGCMKSIYPGLTGIDPANPGRNLTADGDVIFQTAGAVLALSPIIDPCHEASDVLEQLGMEDNPCSGFVTNFLRHFPSRRDDAQEVMNYFDRNVESSIPVFHTLAENFLICDHWFSSVRGPTWANRFYVHSGTSLGRVYMPSSGSDVSHWHWYTQDTIYDRLNDKGISWKIYHDGFPQSLTLTHQTAPKNAIHYRDMDRFFDDAKGPSTDFPSYTFIEPAYFGDNQNDQHPPTNVLHGEALIANVYNAIRANEALWNETLLIVLYDEHGGFYDSEFPPAATPPDDHMEDGYSFDQYGVRVPALLISPWLKKGFTDTVFDHTSILRYVSDKWDLAPLTARVDKANSIGALFKKRKSPRTNTPPTLQPPAIPRAAPEELEFAPPILVDALEFKPKVRQLVVHPHEELNELQKSLIAYSAILEKQTATATPDKRATRLDRVTNSPEEQVEVAHERLDEFLAQQKAEMKKN